MVEFWINQMFFSDNINNYRGSLYFLCAVINYTPNSDPAIENLVIFCKFMKNMFLS